MNKQENLKAVLQKAAEKEGSQKKLADKIGIAKGTLNAYFLRGVFPSENILQKIALYFGKNKQRFVHELEQGTSFVVSGIKSNLLSEQVFEQIKEMRREEKIGLAYLLLEDVVEE